MTGKIFIVTDSPFPHGLAATNRVVSYGKGFIRNGVSAEVVCFNQTESPDRVVNSKVEGIYEGIKFTYISGKTVKSGSFIQRRIDKMKNFLALFLFLVAKVKREDTIIYYSSRRIHALGLWFASRIRKYKILKEESEHPSIYTKALPIGPSFEWLQYRLFDGLLLMTNELVKYFREESKYSKAILHVPMTVDVDTLVPHDGRRAKTIVYCGTLNDRKDGVGLLIKAFARFSKEHSGYTLELYGDAENQEKMREYEVLVARLDISSKVVFGGTLKREHLAGKTAEASILVLPRPDSLQARHGFPTKLGEYLATGNPVVVTSVGEIPVYLKDGFNAYLAEPGDVDSLYRKLSEVVDNSSAAAAIGTRGRQTALRSFNNVIQTRSIIDFIGTLA